MKETQNDAFDKALDLIIDKAAEKANEEIGSELKDVGDKVEFSKEHQAKMREFFVKRRRSKALKKFSKYALRAACVVVTMGIISGVAIFNVEAWRVRFLNFVFEVGEKNTDFGFTEKEKGEYSENMITCSYIPKGFELIETNGDIDWYFASYGNGDYFFQVNVNPVDSSNSIDTENGTVTEITINGMEGFLTESPNINGVVWHDNNYVFTLVGNIEPDELIKIAQNIKVN